MKAQNDIKRVFQSLRPISEVYSTESMYLGGKIQYNGLIRRDSGLLSIWNSRYFVLKIVDYDHMQLIISKTRQSQPEECLQLHQIRLTKKCTFIQNNFCFGIVTDNGTKYLISLKNVHECQQFHAQIVFAKKLTREFFNAFQSRRQLSVANNQRKENSKLHSNGDSKQQTSPEKEQLEEQESLQLIKRRYQRKNKPGLFEDGDGNHNSSQIFQTYLCEPSTSVFEEEMERFDDCSSFFTQDEAQFMLSNQKFLSYPSIDKEKFFVNEDNRIKMTIVIQTSAKLQQCIKQFLQFSSWNQMVKKMQVLDRNKASFILYLEFLKNLTASQARCAIVEVNHIQNDCCAVFRLKSVKRNNFQFMSKKKEVQMELLGNLVVDPCNKLQKVLTLVLSIKPSKEEFELALKFLKEVKQYQYKLSN